MVSIKEKILQFLDLGSLVKITEIVDGKKDTSYEELPEDKRLSKTNYLENLLEKKEYLLLEHLEEGQKYEIFVKYRTQGIGTSN